MDTQMAAPVGPPGVPADPNAGHARAAAWIVLILMGGTTVTFNIWHATHAGHMQIVLALLFGITPVAASMGLSHIVASYGGGWIMKTLTFACMIAAMAMSIGAVGDVVAGTAGHMRWLFGGVLDAAALLTLQVILSPKPAVSVAPAAGLVPHGPAAGSAQGATRGATRGATAEATAGAIEGPAGGAIAGSAGGAIEGPAGGATGRAVRGAIEGPAGGAAEGPAAGPPEGAAGGPGGGVRERGRSRAAAVSQDPDAIAARKEYRKSVQRGEPLNDRQLAAIFPPRSRNWAANRIEEARRQPSLAASRTASG